MLRGLRDPVIDNMGKYRDDFWRVHLSNGIGYYATVGKRKRGEVDQAIAEIVRQVEHWLVCGDI